MIRRGLLLIRPVQRLWREIRALVPEAIHTAETNQNEGHARRSCRLIGTECQPPGSHPSEPNDDPTSPHNGADPKSP